MKPRLFVFAAGALLLVSGVALIAFGQLTPDSVIKPHYQDKHLMIQDWFAAGSGCRSTSRQPGDTSLILIKDSQHPFRYRIVLEPQAFRADGDLPVEKGNPVFARECGLRMGIYPGPGKKIRTISAATTVTLNKYSDIRVDLKSILGLGAAVLDTSQVSFPKENSISNAQVPIALTPDSAGQSVLRALKCEQPKIVGLDISFIIFRQSFANKVQINLGDNRAEITLELETCVAEKSPTKARQPIRSAPQEKKLRIVFR